MAAPTYQAAGTPQAALGGTDLTVPWPTHAVDDIALLWVQRCNETITLSTPAGFVLITSTSAGVGGSNNSQITSVYWCRATSTSMTSPVVSNPLTTASNSYAIAVITTYRGCIGTGNPYDAVGGSADTVANTSYSIPGGTTTFNDCLVALCCAGTRDNAVSSCSNDFANADLTGIGNYVNTSTAAGNGGNINVASSTRAVAGIFGATTGTFTAATSQTKGLLFVALKPPQNSVATGAGTSTVTAVGLQLTASAGSCAGTSSPTAVGSSSALTVASSTGTSTAGAFGAGVALSAWTGAGTSTVSAIGFATARGVGTAIGTTPTASASALRGSEGIASAAGTCTALAIGIQRHLLSHRGEGLHSPPTGDVSHRATEGAVPAGSVSHRSGSGAVPTGDVSHRGR